MWPCVKDMPVSMGTEIPEVSKAGNVKEVKSRGSLDWTLGRISSRSSQALKGVAQGSGESPSLTVFQARYPDIFENVNFLRETAKQSIWWMPWLLVGRQKTQHQGRK